MIDEQMFTSGNLTDTNGDENKKEFSVESPLKCFVIMPFGSKGEYKGASNESDYVYNHIIRKAIRQYEKKVQLSIELIREADRNASGSITKKILVNIATADICIVDITGLNANVFFELGIRYSLRQKCTILLKQENTNIPFDIQGYKCITYDCFKPDLAISKIYDCLSTSDSDYDAIDSLVFETFPKMQVSIPGIVDSVRIPVSMQNQMLWSEWWDRIRQMSILLKESFDNGRFVPTVVVGISNGGLLVADALGREVFKGVPILSFWANRWQADKLKSSESYYYFDNAFNKAITSQLKIFAGKNKVTILLVDDIVFTSNTIIQATNFIEKELVDNYEILFTPMYCRDLDYLESIMEFLPIKFRTGNEFGVTREEYEKRLNTNRTFLPYGKTIGAE